MPPAAVVGRQLGLDGQAVSRCCDKPPMMLRNLRLEDPTRISSQAGAYSFLGGLAYTAAADGIEEENGLKAGFHAPCSR
jgi:hypothetical protein